MDPGAEASSVTLDIIRLPHLHKMAGVKSIYATVLGRGYLSLMKSSAGRVTAEIPSACSMLYIRSV